VDRRRPRAVRQRGELPAPAAWAAGVTLSRECMLSRKREWRGKTHEDDNFNAIEMNT
jgi:hypothetical protein